MDTIRPVALQIEIDVLYTDYRRKKRDVERGLAEMRLMRKEIDILEDKLIIEAMKARDFPKKEVLCA